MRLDFAFGKTGLLVDLPDGFRYRILEARSARSLPDADAALEAAMDAPAGCLPSAVVSHARTAAPMSNPAAAQYYPPTQAPAPAAMPVYGTATAAPQPPATLPPVAPPPVPGLPVGATDPSTFPLSPTRGGN